MCRFLVKSSQVLTSSVSSLFSALPRCVVNFSDPEGYIDSLDDPPLPEGASLCCTYTVTVYTGYGVELQVLALTIVITVIYCSENNLTSADLCSF